MAIAGGEAAAAAAPAAAPPPPSAYMHLTQSVLASLFEVAYGRTTGCKNKTWLTRKLSEAGAPMVVPPGFVPTARMRAEAWRAMELAKRKDKVRFVSRRARSYVHLRACG